MSSFGYPTNVSCSLQWWAKTGWAKVQGVVVSISTDGAEVRSGEAVPAGSTVKFTMDSYGVGDRDARVTDCKGSMGAGYRVLLRLLNGSWPYEAFTALISLGAATSPSMTPAGQLQTTPECLQALGLAMPCTVEDVEQAYYERVRGVHPDRGGDVESFMNLRAAFLQALDLLGERS